MKQLELLLSVQWKRQDLDVKTTMPFLITRKMDEVESLLQMWIKQDQIISAATTTSVPDQSTTVV